MAENPKITQIFIKFLDNKTLTLQFPPQFPITHRSITHKLQSLIEIPQTLTLIFNGKFLSQSTLTKIPNLSTLTLTTPLLGGKGGFGSLLRGAATKAGQKKTNNFDACRDMSGRRLRHVNAEKKMEEWKAGEEERNLEKKGEKFLKDLVKKGKSGKRDDGAEKYVEKYREESAFCVEKVERSVREAALAGRKRKGGVEGGGDDKKLKIWMGKRKMDDSDDSDVDSESDGTDSENEKSAVIDNNGSQSDSSKEAINDSFPVPKFDDDQNGRLSSDSASEEENETSTKNTLEIDANPIVSDLLPNLTVSAEVDDTQPKAADEVQEDSDCKTAFVEEAVVENSEVEEATPPLNFDDFNTASELEVLGMERLKSELQERGLKCGGTLQERASRLFLLKTTPLEKIPKKLLAKK